MQGNNFMSYLPAKKRNLLFREGLSVSPMVSLGTVARLGSVPTSVEES